MIVAIFIVAAKLRLTESQEIQLSRTRDFSFSLFEITIGYLGITIRAPQ
jgi:hypothetical protein